MWWRKEKARPPFTGSSFDAALQWCQAKGERIEIRSADAFDICLGAHVVHVERFVDDDWLHAWAILPDPPLNLSQQTDILIDSYRKFNERQLQSTEVVMNLLNDGRIKARFLKLMKFQGSADYMILIMVATFEYLLLKTETRRYPEEACYSFMKGRKYDIASEAAIDYFDRILDLNVVEKNSDYISFETGGLLCLVSTKVLDNEFSFRYAFSDFMAKYDDKKLALSAEYLSAAYRRIDPKVMSCVFADGASELSISGVLTEGTEAMPIFDRTLAELTQVVLDSMELIKMNPGLVKGTQFLTSEEEAIELASKYHGAKTGGAD